MSVEALVESFENGIFAFGHGHIGLTTAAVTGKLISELASNLETSIDLKAFSADRFWNYNKKGNILYVWIIIY